jgi:hypothetical protein
MGRVHEDGGPGGAGEPGPQASDLAPGQALRPIDLPWDYEAGCWHLSLLDEEGGPPARPSAIASSLAAFALLALGLVLFVLEDFESLPLLPLLGAGALTLLGHIVWRLTKGEPQDSAPDPGGHDPG